MKAIKTVNELRENFLDFFKQKGHTIVTSSSLVPNDETLLFTNAGMVQFKDVFLGKDQRSYNRAASVQRCVRAGGKHNDLENVGYTARHHTFFEMLGNFSFGDYFKREAIQYAWEYLTQVLEIPHDKLWVTVFEDDDDAADIWLKEIKVDKNRFSRCGAKDNFWSMGDTGPCGPSSEIFYDHGPSVPGGPPGSPDAEADRYIEIWNLVFMQFNRDNTGTMTPLPKPSVDTGMGMERLAAIMQKKHSVYEIDLFENLIVATLKIFKPDEPEKKLREYLQKVVDLENLFPGVFTKPEKDKNNSQLILKYLRVLADHIRSVAFLIADGVVPSNEGRGYVLRRIIRRALRHGNRLNESKQPFFNLLVDQLVVEMGDAYPSLKAQEIYIKNVILKEEEQFERTLDQGLKILEQDIKQLHGHMLSGETLFKLYDTYGFPVDLTADIARERNLEVDIAGFEREMEAQRERARAASQFGVDYNKDITIDAKTEFTGYELLEETTSIVTLFKGSSQVAELNTGDKGQLVLKNSPFYAESGGQVGDTGVITNGKNVFSVADTQKIGEAIVHIGEVTQGTFKAEDKVIASVDAKKRQATKLNHSATHLLHAALREIIGTHVTQKGSLVAPDRLRFDFSHFEALTPEQIQKIEDRVNEKILENSEAKITETTPEEAIKQGAMALFGEKYGDKVRVLNMGDGYSVELCGGTHTARTGDIGLFKIISETGIAAGVRRIEALTGKGAMQWLTKADKTLKEIEHNLNTDRNGVSTKITKIMGDYAQQQKEIQRLKGKLASGTGSDLSSDALEIKGLKVLVKKLSDSDPKIMRELVDNLKNKLHTGVVVLAAVNDGKVQLIVGVTKDCIDKISAGDLANFVAQQIGGKGGGRPDLAQAGGTQPESLDKALASVADWISERI